MPVNNSCCHIIMFLSFCYLVTETNWNKSSVYTMPNQTNAYTQPQVFISRVSPPSPLPRIHAELLRNCPGSDPYFPPTTVWHTRRAAARMEFAGFDARSAQRVWPVFPGSDSAPFLLLVCVCVAQVAALLAYTAANSIEGNFSAAWTKKVTISVLSKILKIKIIVKENFMTF